MTSWFYLTSFGFLDPEGGSQKATLVFLILVVIRSLKKLFHVTVIRITYTNTAKTKLTTNNFP